MSELQHRNPNEATGSEVLDALDAFDATRKNLYFAFNEVAAITPDAATYHSDISQKITDTSEAFGTLTSAIRRSVGDIDIAEQTIAQLWLEDDAERVHRFVLLSGGEDHAECFSSFEAEDIDKILKDILAESEDDAAFAKNIQVVYRAGLAGDVGTLSEHIQTRRTERLQEGEIAKEVSVEVNLADVRKHLLDVAKIAGGVALGLLVHKKFSK